jgi:regulator of RNase E activity RraA
MSVDGVLAVRAVLRLLGTARTLRYIPLREDLFAAHAGGLNAQKRVVDTIGAGEVLVMDAGREPGAGTIGDILALRTQVRGAAGLVTDGAIRDYEAVAALGIPTYCAGRHPAVLGRKHVPWEVDGTIACGGTAVQPGDIIVGDSDGVLVLPPGIAAEVAEAAAEQELSEQFITEQVAAGASIAGLYPVGPQWQGEFEQWKVRRAAESRGRR